MTVPKEIILANIGSPRGQQAVEAPVNFDFDETPTAEVDVASVLDEHQPPAKKAKFDP